MADKTALRILGYTYGGITATVMLIAAMVVIVNVGGELTSDGISVVSSAKVR